MARGRPKASSAQVNNILLPNHMENIFEPEPNNSLGPADFELEIHTTAETNTASTSLPIVGNLLRKKRLPLDKKIAILTMIKEKKAVLFGQFSSNLENSKKQEAWNEVREKAQSIGACSAQRDWTWVRDSLFGVWKSRSLEKRDNSRKTGTAGGKKRQPDAADDLIYDIVGKDSPTIQGLPISESLGEGFEINHSAVNDDHDFDFDPDDLEAVVPSIAPKKKKKIEYTEILSQKRALQAELIEVEIYKSKLQCLQLERELGLQPAKFTNKLA